MADCAKITTKKHQKPRQPYWAWIVLLAIILCTGLIRLRLVSTPFERDEGEYAYAGRLILDGIAPYGNVYNMKLPGIYAAYAVILAIFGHTHSAVHTGLLVINAVTILFLFLIGRKLFDSFTGLCAAAAFAVLSMEQSVQGIFANAEHFVIVFAILGIFLLVRAIEESKKLSLAAGAVSLGICLLMKQHGAAFIVFGGLYLILSNIRKPGSGFKAIAANGSIYLAGVLAPFVVTCLILWWVGVFEKFWFWTFDYARQYVASLPLSIGLRNLKIMIMYIAGSVILIWIAAGVGLTGLLWNKKIRKRSGFVAGFSLFSFLAICPGFYFRSHYFILLLPAVGLLAGITMASVRDVCTPSKDVFFRKIIPVILALVILFGAVYQQRTFLFKMTPQQVCYTTYPGNPFCESLEIASYIKEHSTEDDSIAVIGSEPQIYFYTDRRSATGHIYTYALMETHQYASKMQKEMIAEIESARPKFLIFVNVSTSWLVRPNSDQSIFKWFEQYSRNHYSRVGIIDIISPGQAVYRWENELAGYSPRSKLFVEVLERKN